MKLTKEQPSEIQKISGGCCKEGEEYWIFGVASHENMLQYP